ncbi:MAG: hypothetical protein CMQ40_11330 [Gammaproteobacteria bacterium]|nr:hypothetical protein [Gammaproteobacteria bacterium]
MGIAKLSLYKGWSTLGDVDYQDADAFLYLTDRKSFMIISGGLGTSGGLNLPEQVLAFGESRLRLQFDSL